MSNFSLKTPEIYLLLTGGRSTLVNLANTYRPDQKASAETDFKHDEYQTGKIGIKECYQKLFCI